MKRHGHLFGEILSFGNLMDAAKRAMKGKKDRRSVMSFYFDMELELLELKREVKSGTFRPGKLTTFTIHDPKERVISAPPLRDRVLHHAIINVIGPLLDKRFIYHSYACRQGKGMHRAIKYAQSCLQKSRYYVKTDIEHCFPTIDRSVLSTILRRVFKDQNLLGLLDVIIGESGEEDTGLPIGSLTSQWFANLYLDTLDHHLKDELGIRKYLRYMDDMVAFGETKRQMRYVLDEIEGFVKQELHQKLKEKATILAPVTEGLPFLGMMIYPGLIRIRPANKRRSLRRLKRRLWEYRRGEISEDRLYRCVSSITEHLKIGNTYRLRRNIFDEMFPRRQ